MIRVIQSLGCRSLEVPRSVFFQKQSLFASLYPRHDDGLIEGERMDYGELLALHGC